MTEPSLERRRALESGVLAGTFVGAVLLIVSELTTLCRIHIATSHAAISSIGSEHVNHYAMALIALCTLPFAAAVWARGSRLAVLAILALGILALVLALAHDLPRAQTQGLLLIGGAPHIGKATPSAGMYMETLGAIVLIVTGGCGLLLAGIPGPRDG